jgi:hypothetical protein
MTNTPTNELKEQEELDVDGLIDAVVIAVQANPNSRVPKMVKERIESYITTSQIKMLDRLIAQRNTIGITDLELLEHQTGSDEIDCITVKDLLAEKSILEGQLNKGGE